MFVTSFRRITAMTMLVVGVAVCAAVAEERAVQSPEEISEDITPDVGPVVLGQTLTQMELSDTNGTAVGKVTDVVIDPYEAMAVAIVIQPNNGKVVGRFLVPLSLVELSGKKSLTASVAADTLVDKSTAFGKGDEPIAFTRDHAVALFRQHGIEPYWQKGNSTTREPNANDRFVTLSHLAKKAVKNPAAIELGRISDVAIATKNGQIAFTLFAHQHSEHGRKQTRTFPIPLAAFVVPPKTGEWLLELPEALVDNTKPIDSDALPTELSRAWVEYIHVRYGGGVFDGVQRQLKSEK